MVYGKELHLFDTALRTRTWCLVGLALSYLVSSTIVAIGIWAYFYPLSFVTTTTNCLDNNSIDYYTEYRNDTKAEAIQRICLSSFYPALPIYDVSVTSKEIILLTFNVVVTALTECLGYIHATSLRWALYAEDRLQHNSNLRLFTSSNRSWPNKWYINIIWVALMTISYSCASQVLSEETFNGLPLFILGLCLFVLCILGTWALLPPYQQQIITWSSDPLNTALAVAQTWKTTTEATPQSVPLRRQRSARDMHSTVHSIIVFLWTLVPLALAGALVAIIIPGQVDVGFVYTESNSGQSFSVIDQEPGFRKRSSEPLPNVNNSGASVANIIFVAVIQVLYTIALHTAEQLVNVTRDEAAWRNAGNLTMGARVGKESIRAAWTAWPTVFLFIMKPFSHWIFGLSFVVRMDQWITLHPLPLFALAGLAIVLAAFATYLGYRRPQGPQPAAYGDLKKLAELIDDWGEGAGHDIYWGGKGTGSGAMTMGVAGTSAYANNLSAIHMDGRPYLGIPAYGELAKRRICRSCW